MFFPDPGSWFLPIPNPGSKNSNKREGRKKICGHNFLCSHKFHKIANYFSFEVLKKKIWANFQRIIELFTQKIVTKLSNIWIWDPGSGKNLFLIPDPGVKKAPDPGSWIRIRNTVASYSELFNGTGTGTCLLDSKLVWFCSCSSCRTRCSAPRRRSRSWSYDSCGSVFFINGSDSSISVLWIRITLMRIRIRIITLMWVRMRIRILIFMWMRNRIFIWCGSGSRSSLLNKGSNHADPVLDADPGSTTLQPFTKHLDPYPASEA